MTDSNSKAINRQWLLVSNPESKIEPKNFEYREQPFSTDVQLEDGEILLRNRFFLCAPVQRDFMKPKGSGARISIPLGTPVIGPVGSEVIASRDAEFPVGAIIETVAKWEDYSVVTPRDGPPVYRAADGMTLEDLMGPLSLNTLTAYFGLFKVGLPQPGETVVVSAAAGSVGMMACQFAKGHGCRVIGIAGGKAKYDWLVNELKLDGAIDYKSQNVSDELSKLCPEGVDVYFDNVGGDITQAVLDNIAIHGRIVVCGQVASYDSGKPASGPRDMMKIVYSRVRIEGFTISDWAPEMAEARLEVWNWFRKGKLISREDVRMGIAKLPATFMELFEGTNQGSLLVRAD